MRVLLLGAGGQLGRELARTLAPATDLVALDRRGADLADPAALTAAIERVRPQVIVNAGAYTAVDRAEGDALAAEAVNARAPGLLGALAQRHGAVVVHYSSDYVFDGTATGFYDEQDPTAPLSVYGRTKRDGERALAASGADHVTLRTSWVVGRDGANFARTMLKLARERDQLRVVADQHGVPTPTPLLARVTAGLVARLAAGGRDGFPFGLYHLVPGGETTWCDYARHVLTAAAAAGIALRVPAAAVEPILASQYPTPARRPANSRLATLRIRAAFGLALPMWQDALAEVLPDLLHEAHDPP
jgi:dTDP-4-dehydrorhamnose reductase